MSETSNAKTLSEREIPGPFVHGNLVVIVRLLGHDANRDHLVVYADVWRHGKRVLQNEDFHFQNPPIRVPDGTTRKIAHSKHGIIDYPNYKVDHDEALRIILGEAAETAIAHREAKV